MGFRRIALAAVLTFGLGAAASATSAAPLEDLAAQAQVEYAKKGHKHAWKGHKHAFKHHRGHGRHYGWHRGRHLGWHNSRHHRRMAYPVRHWR